MATINQLVKKGRSKKTRKSKSPVLNIGFNTIERKQTATGVIQNLILENRGKLSISGVIDVLSFDDQVVMVETELGLLTVKGENIRINKLSIDTSEVIVEGDISYLAYSDKEIDKNKGGSILNKIFK